MRIIAGEYRGRKLKPLVGKKTRPTSDRLREAIFSSLTHKLADGFKDVMVADIFAGTGAMGLEAVSRGAKHATFVEKHAGLNLIKENAEMLGCDDKCNFLGADARKLPEIKEPLDVIFLDPPYGRGLAEPAITSAYENGWIKSDTKIVVELDKKDEFSVPDGFIEIQEKVSGRTKVIYLEPAN